MACPHSASDESCAQCAAEEQATYISEGKPKAEKADGLDYGSKVDRYVVHDLIGRGGMGLVYTAHDPDLDRWVAIKLLRSSAAPGDAASIGQARLMREAQAMAQLSHPNVMPVYDVGKLGESVFVAMELVRGLTLDKWVKAERRTWRQVLDMFLQAGRGLQAAHAAGLVHRDFKPANVLIGEDGRPRVTDFGIARSLRAGEKLREESATPAPTPTPTPTPQSTSSSSLDTPLTRAGALMGSPGYMAPEQYAGLQTSPATDQFSFCVALYEALYGKRPFHGATLSELAHVTTLGHVPPAPKGSAVPPWLHRVVEKGLAAEAKNRHASMTALLDALSVDPDLKLRRQLFAAGVGLFVAASVGATVWSQVQTRRACRGADALLLGVWDEAARTKGQQAFDATGKSYAGLAWEHARSEMDTYASSWVRARTDACEATRLRGEQSEEVMSARIACLDQRRDELQALAAAYAEADVDTVDRAYGAASRLSDIAACSSARVDKKQPPPEAKEAVQQLGHELAQGRSLVSAGKFDQGRDRITSALQIARALKLPAQLAACELALGEVERETKRYAKANEALQRAVQKAEAAGDDATAATALTQLVSLVGWRLERPEEGRAMAAIAAGKLERIGGDRRTEALLAEALGDAEWQAGDRPAALTTYQSALLGFTALEGPDGLDVARLHSSVGWILTEQGALGEARVELMRSKATREKLLGPEHPTLIGTWNELGTLGLAMGEEQEAIAALERALQLSRAAYGNDSIGTSRAALNLAVALARGGRAEEAEPLFEHAREVVERHPDAPNSHPVHLRRTRALLDYMQGRYEQSEAAAREGLELSEKAFGALHPDTALLAGDLARALDARGKWKEALEQYDRWLKTTEHLGATGDADYPLTLAQSASPLLHLSREKEALERLEKAVAMLPLDKGNHHRAGTCRFLLAAALPKGERSRALALEARSELELAGRADEVKKVDGWLSERGK